MGVRDWYPCLERRETLSKSSHGILWLMAHLRTDLPAGSGIPSTFWPLPLLCYSYPSTSLGCFVSLLHSSLPWVATVIYKPEGETMVWDDKIEMRSTKFIFICNRKPSSTLQDREIKKENEKEFKCISYRLLIELKYFVLFMFYEKILLCFVQQHIPINDLPTRKLSNKLISAHSLESQRSVLQQYPPTIKLMNFKGEKLPKPLEVLTWFSILFY